MKKTLNNLSRNLNSTEPLKNVLAKTVLDTEVNRTNPTLVKSASPGRELMDMAKSISKKVTWIRTTAEIQIQQTQKPFGATSKVELQTTIMNTATQLVPNQRYFHNKKTYTKRLKVEATEVLKTQLKKELDAWTGPIQ